MSAGRRRLSADFQLLFRLVKGCMFITLLSVFVILVVLTHMTLKDVVVCILAFMPTGWGMLLVSKSFLLLFFCHFLSLLLSYASLVRNLCLNFLSCSFHFIVLLILLFYCISFSFLFSYRLHKLARNQLNEQDFGSRFKHLLVVIK